MTHLHLTHTKAFFSIVTLTVSEPNHDDEILAQIVVTVSVE
jgi:hypothetical protein